MDPHARTEFARLAVVGAGAIGGYYGAQLARHAGPGQSVAFLLRADYEAVRARGFLIRRRDGTVETVPVEAHREAAAIGPVDLILYAAKATANAELAPVLRALRGPETVVLTLQNGMGNREFLAREVAPPEYLLAGLCFACLNRVGPGEIDAIAPGHITFAEAFGDGPTPRLEAVVARCQAAGIKARALPSFTEAIWRKLCWNVPFNGLAIAAGGLTTDRILASPPLVALARALMEEVRQAAAADGVAIEDDFLDQQFRVTAPMGPYRPSSLIDWQAGRPVEVDAIWGEPLRRARARGLTLGRLEALHALLRHLCA